MPDTPAAAATLTIASTLHGERLWRRVGERDHVTRDGRNIVLAVWQSTCVVCGEAFEVATPASIKTVEQGRRSFETTTCPAHRLTPSEVAKLRFASEAEDALAELRAGAAESGP